MPVSLQHLRKVRRSEGSGGRRGHLAAARRPTLVFAALVHALAAGLLVALQWSLASAQSGRALMTLAATAAVLSVMQFVGEAALVSASACFGGDSEIGDDGAVGFVAQVESGCGGKGLIADPPGSATDEGAHERPHGRRFESHDGVDGGARC